MIKNGKWIAPLSDMGEVCPVFKKDFALSGKVRYAALYITAIGVYEAQLNGERVGDFILAPGWTVYTKRHQYQCYDISEMLGKDNTLKVTVGKGWYRSMLGWERNMMIDNNVPAVIACITIEYDDGRSEMIVSDDSWMASESKIRFCEIYDGERYDANIPEIWENVKECEIKKDNLIPQEGEIVKEQERIKPLGYIVTPKGEKVIDFGQNITGYVEFTVNAKKNDKIIISCAEVLDKDGNFYNANYRSAKSLIDYTCRDGIQTHKPTLTFMGFRYIRLDEFPTDDIDIENFTAIVVHSEMKRIGHLQCSDPMLNKLFENIIWGQKGNYLDIPTDCPQRDERLGWTGDAEVFVRAASYNYDVEKFFMKWLNDLACEQGEDGFVPHVIPNAINHSENSSAAWADAAVICPWQIYLTYGNKAVLKQQFESMKKWISYITTHTDEEFLWIGGTHFGDWLGLDVKNGDRYDWTTDNNFIASAYYLYSTSLVIKAGRALNEDMSEYEELYKNILNAIRNKFTEYPTQTACALALYFDIAEDKQKTADKLNDMVAENGNKLTTGFVGTPYLLHALSQNGHADTAYSLLLQTEYPSWLYSVKMGATTIWEHWDGIREDGTFWSDEMNSYNHYAYGAVADWVYGVAAGIRTVEEKPGFEEIIIEPVPDKRLDWLSASIDTRYGTVMSKWQYVDGKVRYEIRTPVKTKIIINGKEYTVGKGVYIF